jgi:hypothetical protein
MKNKDEITNYEEKAKVLHENGWYTWYHDDNWIKKEWVEKGLKYDTMGQETDDVYNSIISRLEFKKFEKEQFLLNEISDEETHIN